MTKVKFSTVALANLEYILLENLLLDTSDLAYTSNLRILQIKVSSAIVESYQKHKKLMALFLESPEKKDRDKIKKKIEKLDTLVLKFDPDTFQILSELITEMSTRRWNELLESGLHPVLVQVQRTQYSQ